MLTGTMLPDARVVCNQCNRHLRVVSRNPDRLEVLTQEAAMTKNGYPESFA
ncbi:MAG: hypothetical protein NVS4B8_13550 [Herpetosiphon sp.]